jgi:alanyl-tRNA synthetase
MAPFKSEFVNPQSSQYTQVTTIQKCLRVGGKHNDLSNVGFTKRHHTFFEMCGCFSFDGKVSKKDIMFWSYDFLVTKLKLPTNLLKFSYLTGDMDTLALWQEITSLPVQQFFADPDNTWSMGDVGPFGACTEIYYQTEEELLEIWNIVFITHNRKVSGQVEALPYLCIDTGMGLERLAAVCQGVESTFDTDILSSLQASIKELLGCEAPLTLRILSDHMRALVMLAADNLTPSAEGRGYVMRRIARRALIFALRSGITQSVLATLVPATVELMATGYPDLTKQVAMIQNLLQAEEDKFTYLINSTQKLLMDAVQKCESIMPGEVVFKLYTTYGIPLEMIEDTCASYGLTLDMATYKQLLEQSKVQPDAFNKLKNITVVKTEFKGYDVHSLSSRVMALYAGADYIPVNNLQGEGAVILDRTVFYAQAGGQQGDQGLIKTKAGTFQVMDTIYKDQCILHLGYMLRGELKEGDLVEATYDLSLREILKRHHTATHLLHKALTELYGDKLVQKGSAVQTDKLRFDFTDPQAKLDVQAIEDLVNQYIFHNYPCVTEHLTLTEAKARNVVMLEGCNYGEVLRVLTIGDYLSVEACGGTHVNSTGEIGIFKITDMYKINASTRRIDAVCSLRALELLRRQEQVLKRCQELTGCGPDKLAAQIATYKELGRERLASVEQLQECLYEEQVGKHNLVIGDLKVKVFKIPGDKILRKKITGVKRPLCFINLEAHKTTLYLVYTPAVLLGDTLKSSLGAQGGGKKDKLLLTVINKSVEEIITVLTSLLQ